jgi:hypothetical protein
VWLPRLSRLCRRVMCFTRSEFRQIISNFAIPHSSGFDRNSTSTSIDIVLKSNWSAISRSPHFGAGRIRVGATLEDAKFTESAGACTDACRKTSRGIRSKSSGLIAARETFVAIETHETLLIVPKKPRFSIAAREITAVQAALGEPHGGLQQRQAGWERLRGTRDGSIHGVTALTRRRLSVP